MDCRTLAKSTCEPPRPPPLSPSRNPYPSPTPDYPSQMMGCKTEDTPVRRKNKRKLSEPRKRPTDFSIKRFCPDSPRSEGTDSGCSEEASPLQEESPVTPEGCVAFIPDHADDSSSHGHSDRESVTPVLPIHSNGAMLFPGEVPTNCMVPNIYYGKVAFPTSDCVLARINGHISALNGHHLHNRVNGYPLSINNIANVARHAMSVGDAGRVNSSFTSPSTPDRTVRSESRGAEIDDYPSPSTPSTSSGGKKTRKNYKNMTRERRVEANARERSRVHTISAAFETLRRAVPSYSYNQKLSKLAILRIACNYIMALAKLVDLDYSVDQSNLSFSDCVDLCTNTIQAEGRARRRH